MRRKRNITLNLQNITPHFTGKAKIITLVFIIIMLSFVNIINTSALSYQSSVGVGFTFNPALSVNISPSDLVIPNLTPGTTSDSNIINVSVASNASYGYTLSAIVNGNNSNLTHANGTNTFSSIAIDNSLSGLTTDNTWGYSYKLSNDPNWNNYSGLSNETSKTLVDSNDQTAIPIDFKIGAKASSTQASGTYTGVINFTAITKHIPIALEEAYASEGKTMINGFYTMQDMTSTICDKTEAIGAQLQVLDERDNKLYWISKLADNHCWMTQNLDLDLDSNRTYTHWDTDLGWSTEGNNSTGEGSIDENVTWKPSHSTIIFDGANTNQVPKWVNSYTEPYSANPGDIYYYTSGTGESDIKYNSLQECTVAGHNDCAHYHAGNYYNWSAAVASNNTSEITSGSAPNSICAKGWKLQNHDTMDFGNLLHKQDITTNIRATEYTSTGFNNVRKSPIYLIRPGGIWEKRIDLTYGGLYWSSNGGSSTAFSLYFRNDVTISDTNTTQHRRGISIRCLAR